MLSVLIQVLLMLLFGSSLIVSTNILVGAFARLSRLTKISKFGITALLMAVATSLPELIVAIISSLQGQSVLSLGNILGSNISNLTLVIGGAALVGGGLSVVGTYLRRDLLIGAFVGSLPLALLVDGSLSRLDGVILIVTYLVFARVMIMESSPKILIATTREETLVTRLFAYVRRRAVRHNLMQVSLGLLVLVLSGYALVEVARALAYEVGVPIILIGLFLVAIGTTLPELSFAIRAVRSREASMVLGNLVGSLAANSTLVIGIAAVIDPVEPDGGLGAYLIATLSYLAIFAMFYLFSYSKRKVSRGEGAILIAAYIALVFAELIKAGKI